MNEHTYSKSIVIAKGERLLSGRIFVWPCPYCDKGHYHQAKADETEITRQSDCVPGGEYLVKIKR